LGNANRKLYSFHAEKTVETGDTKGPQIRRERTRGRKRRRDQLYNLPLKELQEELLRREERNERKGKTSQP